MSRIAIGDTLPKFTRPTTSDITLKSTDLKNKKVVLYFYPRDNTPGCTTEGQDFSREFKKFQRAGALVYGISRDSIKKHENFKCKYEFPFELISDEDETLCQLFDVMVNKNMYGKKVRGIERSTFVFDEKGKLRHEWRKVKVDGHVAEVLAAVKAL